MQTITRTVTMLPQLQSPRMQSTIARTVIRVVPQSPQSVKIQVVNKSARHTIEPVWQERFAQQQEIAVAKQAVKKRQHVTDGHNFE